MVKIPIILNQEAFIPKRRNMGPNRFESLQKSHKWPILFDLILVSIVIIVISYSFELECMHVHANSCDKKFFKNHHNNKYKNLAQKNNLFTEFPIGIPRVNISKISQNPSSTVICGNPIKASNSFENHLFLTSTIHFLLNLIKEQQQQQQKQHTPVIPLLLFRVLF